MSYNPLQFYLKNLLKNEQHETTSILWKITLKINDTKKSNSNNQLKFYIKNPHENERQEKIDPLQFHVRNPYKNE